MHEILTNNEYCEALCGVIDRAKTEIYICMYDWRANVSDPSAPVSRINSALVRAVRRGVRVSALVNHLHSVEILRALGARASRNLEYKMMHAKFICSDQNEILCGSHNVTHNALTQNFELSILIESEEIRKEYVKIFNQIWRE